MTASLTQKLFAGSLGLAAIALMAGCGGAPSTPPGGRPPEPVSRTVANVENEQGKSMEELFAGRFPGVQVFRLGSGGISIRIRGGANSFYGGSEPLYVVDGVALQGAGGDDGLRWLNPQDISTIEVLRDAAQTALYGVQGANGVVLITTKTAKKR